jgi:type IV secretory pathway VirB2 component (pilin)
MTSEVEARSRIPGVVLMATAVAGLALLLNHPAESATDFAGVLKEEAANQFINGIVHGGFIVVLTIQLACYAIFSGRIGWQRGLAITGMVFFTIGAAFQMASLTVDGLVIPQLAAHTLAGPPDRIPFVRSLFTLCGTAIQFLMPIGLAFQGAGVTSWGASLMPVAHGTGAIGLAIGLIVVASIIGATVTGNMMLTMAAIALLLLWAAFAGLAMFRRVI